MKKKLLTLSGVVLVLFISCMHKEKLNYFHEFLIAELFLFVVFLLSGIARLYFLTFQNRTLLQYLTYLILINLIAIACLVIKYPIVVRQYNFIELSK